MNIKETNIIIIGSGVVGGVIAEKLLQKGIGPIVMLEAGAPVLMKDRRTWLDLVMSGDKTVIPYKSLSDTKDDFETDPKNDPGIPWNLDGGRLLARGGSTLHWGGWCPRMKPEDFQLKSRVGTGGLDWPFTYDDIEPYYLQAERYLQVAGDSKDQDPPRSAPYPYEAPPFTLTDNFVIEGLKKNGVSHIHIPIARNAKPINGMPACVTTGTCDYCPIGARFTGNQPLDRLEKNYQKDKFELITHAAARQILVDQKKRATGVQYVNTKTNQTFRIDAQKIIICAGSLEAPKLLMASTSTYWENGIGNDTDHVGRYVVANPFFYFTGVADKNPRKIQEELFIPTLGSRHWDTPEFQREGKFFLNKAAMPDIKLSSLISGKKSIKEIEAATVGKQQFQLQGTVQTFSHFENRIKLDKGTTRFGLPRTVIEAPIPAVADSLKSTVFERLRNILKILEYKPVEVNDFTGYGIFPQRGDHAMCTTRMSASPAEGVVDSNCKIHGMDNLFIVSNSVFPSGAAANPTLTLVALALRFMDVNFNQNVSQK